MLSVDAQIHIWGNGLPTTPAHRQIAVYSQDDALRDMDAAGVDAAGLHSCYLWTVSSWCMTIVQRVWQEVTHNG